MLQDLAALREFALAAGGCLVIADLRDGAAVLRPEPELLSAAERLRARRFLRSDDARSYVAAHVLKRLLLGAVTGREPWSLAFGADALDKPTLDGDPGVAFSLSHTSGMAAVALSRDGAVGVDVECLENAAHHAEVASLVLQDEEARAMGRSPDPSRAFLRHWTAKEAAQKAEGKGVSLPMREIRVERDRVHTNTTSWRLAHYEPTREHVLALVHGVGAEFPAAIARGADLWQWTPCEPRVARSVALESIDLP